MNAVWDAISKLYGEYGASRTSLALIDYDLKKRLVILRTGHTTLEMVRTVLASITKIGNNPLAVHVLAVSGTVKALCRRIGQQREEQ